MTTLKLLGSTTVLGGGLGIVAATILGATYGAVVGITFLADIFSSSPSGAFRPFYEDIVAGLMFVFMVSNFGLVLALPFGFFGGLGGGLLLGIFTHIFFYPPSDVQQYHKILGVTSAIYGVLASVIPATRFFGTVLPTWHGGPRGKVDFSLYLLYPILPALLAGLGAVFVSQRIAKWYEREFDKGVTPNA